MDKDVIKIDKTLRPYQQQAKDDIFAAWADCNNVLFQMPTGTGKTRLFSSLISDIKTWGILNKEEPKILIIAHRIELIEQISENLERYKVSHGIIAGGKERNLRPCVQVASIQTITHRANFDVVNTLNPEFIIIDEAHHSTANSYKKLWEYFPNAKKLGVTATPWRMNHSGFASIFDKLIVSESIQNFIDQGWLSPYCYYSIKDDAQLLNEINNINEFDIEGDYKVSALEHIMDTMSIRAKLLDSYLTIAKGKKGIIYSISRKHSDHICEEYRNAGINIVRIDSETPKDERRLFVQRFKNGLVDIIVNVDIFSEGFDCPDIEFIQLARPTKSLVKYLQQVGRGLRPTANKEKCIILDNVGAHYMFGMPNSERNWEVEFVGTPHEKAKRSSSTKQAKHILQERDFHEGSDVLSLVQNVDSPSEPNNNWNVNDDELLLQLYNNKKCSIQLLADIFKVSTQNIEERLSIILTPHQQ